MRGSHGLAFVLFSALVWLARWAGLGFFQDIDPTVMQAITLLGVFGIALLLTSLLVGFLKLIARVFE
jgi:hypothetical protein